MRFILSFIIIMFSIGLYGQQGLINNGMKIVIAEGSTLVIQDDYVNQSLGESQHGEIISDGEIIVQGNWFNNALIGGVFHSINELGVVRFNAPTNQIIGGKNSSNFENLLINNNGLMLYADVNVTNSISLVSGVSQLMENNITINANTLISGTFSNANMLATNGSGKLRQKLEGAAAYYFPLGDINGIVEYSPAQIQVTDFSGSDEAYLSVSVENGAFLLVEDYPDLINRYWEINYEGINSIDYNGRFFYKEDDVVGNENNLFATSFINGESLTHELVNADAHSFEVNNNTEVGYYSAASNKVSIEQFSIPEAFQIYPNPSNGKFKLVSNLQLASNVEVEIYDEKGVMVANSKFDAHKNNIPLALEFNLQSLSKGVYIVNIVNEMQVTKRKMIIQ